MTDERLSSSATFFYRWLFAPLWLLGFNGAVLGLLLRGSTPTSGALSGTERAILLTAAVLGSAFVLTVVFPLRTVRLRGASLLVTQWGREVLYPGTDLLKVTQVPLVRPASAILLFRTDHGAGTRIRLLLPFTLWSPVGAPFLGEAPSVTALRQRLLPATGKAAV